MLLHYHIPRIKGNESNEWIIVRIFLALGIAMFSILPSVYLTELGVSGTTIGLVFSGINLLSFFLSFYYPYFLEKYNQKKTFIFTVILAIILYILMSFFMNPIYFIILYSIIVIIGVLRFSIQEIQFRDGLKDNEYSKKKGLLSAIINIMWVIMPAIGGVILENYGFNLIFYIVAICFLMSLFFLLFLNVPFHIKKRESLDKFAKENIIYFIKRIHLIYSFMTRLSLRIWYTFVFVFVPIFIVNQGFSKEYIGIFLTATQIPLVFIQFKLNYFIQKFGMRNLFIYSYFGLFIISIIAYLFSNNIIIIIILFGLSGILLGFLEVIPDLYYFKQVNSLEEEKTYSIYSNGGVIGNIIGNSLFAILLIFIPVKFLFIIVGVFMGCFGVMSLYMKDYKS